MKERINYQEYLKSDYWQTVRDHILSRDGYRCRLCNLDIDLQVHHRTYDNLGEEKFEDLITLCGFCHSTFHKENNFKYTKMKNREREIADEKLLEMKEIANIKDVLKQHSEALSPIQDNLIAYNFIRTSEFLKIAKKVNKKRFDNILFINVLLDYFNAINIYPLYSKQIKEKYGLPKRALEIVIPMQIYIDEEDNFTRYPFGKF